MGFIFRSKVWSDMGGEQMVFSFFFWNGKARLRYVTPYGLVGFYGVGFGGSVGALRFSLAGLIFF
jgi:hypothetical protein